MSHIFILHLCHSNRTLSLTHSCQEFPSLSYPWSGQVTTPWQVLPMSRRGLGLSGGGWPPSPFNPAHRLLFRMVVRHLGISEPYTAGEADEWGGRHLRKQVSSGYGCVSGAPAWSLRPFGDTASACNLSAHLLHLLPFVEVCVWVFCLFCSVFYTRILVFCWHVSLWNVSLL